MQDGMQEWVMKKKKENRKTLDSEQANLLDGLQQWPMFAIAMKNVINAVGAHDQLLVGCPRGEGPNQDQRRHYLH